MSLLARQVSTCCLFFSFFLTVCTRRRPAGWGVVIHSFKTNEYNLAFTRQWKKQQQILIFNRLKFRSVHYMQYANKILFFKTLKREVTEETEFSNSSTSWPTTITERQTTVTAFGNAVIINMPVENVPLITVFLGASLRLCIRWVCPSIRIISSDWSVRDEKQQNLSVHRCVQWQRIILPY